MFTLNGGIVSWKSSKLETIVDSTSELEYIMAFDGSYGSGLEKHFIHELGVVPSIVDLIL